MKIVVYSKVKNKENVWKYSRVKRLQRRKTHYCAGLLSCSTLISVPVLFSLSKHNPLDFFYFVFSIHLNLERLGGVWKALFWVWRESWLGPQHSGQRLTSAAPLLRESVLILKQAAIKYQSGKTWMEPIYFTTLDLQRFPPHLAIFSWLNNLLWRAAHLHDLTSLFINSPHSHLSDVHRPSDETCSYKIHSKFGSLWNVL